MSKDKKNIEDRENPSPLLRNGGFKTGELVLIAGETSGSHPKLKEGQTVVAQSGGVK